jgi:hypothetical protein
MVTARHAGNATRAPCCFGLAEGYGERMRVLLSCLLLLFAACGGPGQGRLAETPTANSRANTGLAPPASQSDRDRYELVDSMDSMDATQRAYREADQTTKQAPPAPLPGQPANATKPVKTKDGKRVALPTPAPHDPDPPAGAP